MEPRLIIAYSLIFLVVVLAVCFVAYSMYHSNERTYRRRLRREGRAYRASQAPPP